MRFDQVKPETWERVKDLFDTLVDSDPADRAERLRDVDEDVRALVQELLANHEEAGAAIWPLGGDVFPQSKVVRTLLNDIRVFEPGQRLLDRFEIRSFLGVGGMGEVYEAFDGSLQEPVAIKTVRFDLSFEQAVVERFKREVQRSRRVTHANVCRVYELFSFPGTYGVETSFLTMELLRGVTLFQNVKESGPLPEAEALHLALQMCSGLAAAHAAGVIHGDFKSGNVIITAAPEGRSRAVITDFGLARLAEAAESSRSVTAGAAAPGTAAYMAPELVRGERATRRSDLYALGVVLFRMLTGRYPNETGEPPPRLARNWDRAIESCLAPDPARRPSSADEVAALLKGAGVFTRRHLVHWAYAGGATAAILAAAEGWRRWSGTLSSQSKHTVLVADFDSPDAGPALGRAVRNLFRVSFAGSSNIHVLNSKEIKAAVEALNVEPLAIRDQVAREVAQQARANLVIGGSVKTAGEGYHLRVSVFDVISGRELRSVEEIAADKRELPASVSRASHKLRLGSSEQAAAFQVGGIRLEQADTLRPDALELFTRGLEQYSQGESKLALELFKDSTRLDPEFSIAYVYQAVVYAAFRRCDLGFEPAHRAFELRDRVGGRQRHHAEALYHIVCGDYQKALDKYRYLAEIDPRDAQIHRQLAQSYANLEQTAKSLSQAREAVQLDPGSAINQMMLMCALADVNQGAEALEVMQRVPSALRSTPLVGMAKGYVHLLQDEVDQALAAYEPASQHRDLSPMARSYQMKALLLGGRLEEARQRLEVDTPVYQIEDEQANEDLWRYWLGQLLVLTGRRSAAVVHAQSLATRPAIPPSILALRAAAEVAAQAGSIATLRIATARLKAIASGFPSNRADGVATECEGLLAGAEQGSSTAKTLLVRAHRLWNDIPTSWMLAGELYRQGLYSEALPLYERIIAAKATALRFDWVLYWVRSLAMAGLCCDATKDVSQAVAFFDKFLHYWGNQTQVDLVRHVLAVRSGSSRSEIEESR